MLLVLKTVFDSELLSIRHAVANPSSTACSPVYHGVADLLLMPITGVFARHDSPRQHFLANSNHALFLATENPIASAFPAT